MAVQSTPRTPSLIKNEIFELIKDKQATAFDFQDLLSKTKKYFTPNTLLSKEGLNILQACLEKGRLSFLTPILHTGWWRDLSEYRVAEDRLRVHKGKTAKEIADSKKARKPLEEYNNIDEWEKSLTPLMRACRSGDVSEVKHHLQKDPRGILSLDYNNCNALYWAVISGNLELFNVLVNNEANVNTKTKKGESLLHVACSVGHHQFVKELIQKYKLDPFLEDANNKTPLDRVAENGDTDALIEFIKCEVKLPPNLLPISAFTGRLPFVTYLFENIHLNIDSGDMYERTALHRACEGDKVEVAKYVVTKGARLDLYTKMNRNILHIAAEKGNLDLLSWIVSELETKGSLSMLSALINVQDKYNGVDLCFLIRGRDKGRDAFHYVEVTRDKAPIFLKKVKAGNVDVALYGKVLKSGWGVSPDQDIVDEIEDMFRKRRLDTNAPADMTPLHIAIAKGHTELAILLIEKGATLDIVDHFGLTPVHLAASLGNVELMELLDTKGADFRAVSRDGKSVLDIAEENEHEEVISYLGRRSGQQVIQDFLQGPLNDLSTEISQDRMNSVQQQGEDTRQHLISTLRNFRLDINQLLLDLDSGPVVQVEDEHRNDNASQVSGDEPDDNRTPGIHSANVEPESSKHDSLHQSQ